MQNDWKGDLEQHVGTALEYLAASPHPLAIARKAVVDAENKCKRIFARHYLDGEGSIEARKALAEVSTEYSKARFEESEAIQILEDERAKFRWAENIIELYRTESANVRIAERIR